MHKIYYVLCPREKMNFVLCLHDFFASLLGTNLPTSSYRLGVKAANLHELFPTHITEALKHSISMFDQEVLISYSLISSYNNLLSFQLETPELTLA